MPIYFRTFSYIFNSFDFSFNKTFESLNLPQYRLDWNVWKIHENSSGKILCYNINHILHDSNPSQFDMKYISSWCIDRYKKLLSSSSVRNNIFHPESFYRIIHINSLQKKTKYHITSPIDIPNDYLNK